MIRVYRIIARPHLGKEGKVRYGWVLEKVSTRGWIPTGSAPHYYASPAKAYEEAEVEVERRRKNEYSVVWSRTTDVLTTSLTSDKKVFLKTLKGLGGETSEREMAETLPFDFKRYGDACDELAQEGKISFNWGHSGDTHWIWLKGD